MGLKEVLLPNTIEQAGLGELAFGSNPYIEKIKLGHDLMFTDTTFGDVDLASQAGTGFGPRKFWTYYKSTKASGAYTWVVDVPGQPYVPPMEAASAIPEQKEQGHWTYTP